MVAQFNFFKEAIKSIQSSGTIFPSSRWLTKKILYEIDFSNAKVIVEFGGGNGVFTKQILSNLSPNGKLIVFEVNPYFYNELLQIEDNRITILHRSADEVKDVLNKYHTNEVDYIISSLPLSNMNSTLVNAILEVSYQVLANNGKFVQFQYSLFYYRKLNKIFNRKLSLKFELLNFPPAFIYSCVKRLHK